MERAAICAFMQQFRYGVLSSLSGSGSPQSALVGIATTPDLEIVFDTVKSSRKYANLKRNPSCSFVVGGWDSEQTVQFEGLAIEPIGEELDRCREAYFAVWPDGRARLSWPGLTHFAVKPTWIRYCDYDQKPALIEEMHFSS